MSPACSVLFSSPRPLEPFSPLTSSFTSPWFISFVSFISWAISGSTFSIIFSSAFCSAIFVSASTSCSSLTTGTSSVFVSEVFVSTGVFLASVFVSFLLFLSLDNSVETIGSDRRILAFAIWSIFWTCCSIVESISFIFNFIVSISFLTNPSALLIDFKEPEANNLSFPSILFRSIAFVLSRASMNFLDSYIIALPVDGWLFGFLSLATSSKSILYEGIEDFARASISALVVVFRFIVSLRSFSSWPFLNKSLATSSFSSTVWASWYFARISLYTSIFLDFFLAKAANWSIGASIPLKLLLFAWV